MQTHYILLQIKSSYHNEWTTGDNSEVVFQTAASSDQPASTVEAYLFSGQDTVAEVSPFHPTARNREVCFNCHRHRRYLLKNNLKCISTAKLSSPVANSSVELKENMHIKLKFGVLN